MDTKRHWQEIYLERSPADVSWYQAYPAISLELIEKTRISMEDSIIDVGGGASLLPQYLLEAGYCDISVLDLSAKAIELNRAQLGERADEITWYECDVLEFMPERRFCLWHDRAVLHFLIDSTSQQRYADALRRALTYDGHVIIATFAVGGPERCSGLPVQQHDSASIQALLGEAFGLIETRRETHRTPQGIEQEFEYFRLKREEST